MNILVYLDPLISERLHHLDYVYNGILFKNQNTKNYSLKFMLAKQCIESQQLDPAYSKLDLVPIDENAYYALFSPREKEQIHIDVLLNRLSSKEIKELSAFYSHLFNNWEPDVIIFYEYDNPVLRALYPKALCVSSQAGIFARKPFPVSLFFDPHGFLRNNSLKAFEKEIRQFTLTNEQNTQLNFFKNSICSVIDSFNPFKNKFRRLRKKFSHLILLPLSAPPKLFVKTELNFADMEAMFTSLMEKIPANVGVVMTQHPAIKLFNEEQILQLQQRYSNLIYIHEVEFYSISSLFLFQFVDAIINFHSTTGFQSLLWDKKIISVANTSNDLIKDAQGIESLVSVLQGPSVSKNNILYWLLTRYYTYEFTYSKPNYILNYFNMCREYILQHGLNFSYFKDGVSIEQLQQCILPSFKQHVQQMVQNSIEKRNKARRTYRWFGHKLILKHAYQKRCYFWGIHLKFMRKKGV